MSQGYIGEKLGSFRLEEILGSGAMGVVFRGVHETTGRPVAVKIVHAELGAKGKVFERFEREAEILKQFRHPNIVRWLAWGRFKGTSYFAMEYVHGVTLEKIIKERGEMPWREVVGLAIQLCDALHYAHELSIVHRDLKPSNLMITGDGKLKLTDFGIAKDLDRTTQLTAPGRTLGTAAYMGPEQIRGTPAVSHKTDLYALGIILYQMLTGKAPFDGASAVVLMHSHLNEPPPRPSDKVETIPKELDDLVVKLMAKSPADRPWDAAAVCHTLKELRDKADRGEKIPMVWPEPGSRAANPVMVGTGTSSSRSKKKKSRKTGTFAGLFSGFAASGHDAGESRFRLLNRRTVETLGLVAMLIAIGGFIGYWLWPPSAEYLYNQAAAGMASSQLADWRIAQEQYFDELDRKYPDHPYKEQLQKWRDQIALTDVQRRAEKLSSAVKGAWSEPHTNGERQFLTFYTLAEKVGGQGNEKLAVQYWREMARLLKPDDRDERPWHLLAVQNADALEAKIQKRQTDVREKIQQAEAELAAGRPNGAVLIWALLRDTYGKYTDVSDLLGSLPVPNTQASPPGTDSAPPTPVVQPAAPDVESGTPSVPEQTPKSGESSNTPGDK